MVEVRGRELWEHTTVGPRGVDGFDKGNQTENITLQIIGPMTSGTEDTTTPCPIPPLEDCGFTHPQPPKEELPTDGAHRAHPGTHGSHGR